ncbi:C-X-C motif chemokine 16 [Phalacrocorax carbo]|uniref:C-X-C motif chemokine 16 n=1 Tax=Phalacrocorax carbo TaxID=9209 RepID=UPI0031194B28
MGLGLLLLLLPWGALGNMGGSAGACGCTRSWIRQPPPGVHLPHMARHVLRAEPCPNHILRFMLPKWRLCGLQNSPWVVELLHLWERQVAQRALARLPATDRPMDGPSATDRPTDRPPAEDGPLATDGPPARFPASHLAPLSPAAPEGPPPGPTERCSPSPPASRLGEGHGDGGQLPGGPQALLPAPTGWTHWEAMGQDPQMPPPSVGQAPHSVGLAMAVGLVASMGLVLAFWWGCRGAGRGRGAGVLPPTQGPADSLLPHRRGVQTL